MDTAATRTITLAISGPIRRADLPGLCERVCLLLKRSSPDVAICDVSGVDPDAVTIDTLARLQLAAQRHACQIRLQHASLPLLELVAFMGLHDVLPIGSRADTGRADTPTAPG